MEKTREKKAVGIWIRVSTEDQARGESPEHHEKRARYYAESKEWNIKEVYHLEAVSGKAVIAHPEAQKMIEHIKTGHITGLIFSKLARLARNTRELLEFADLFNQYGADLISLQESIDTSTPAGRLFYTMIAAMAQWEREEIASRVAASIPIRAKLGKMLGGKPVFGYQIIDKKMVPDPKEAPIVKLMFELFWQEKRKRVVARMLNQKGYRTRVGAKFSDTSVDRLLTDPTFKGLHRLNYTKSLGDKKHWVMKPKEDWVILKVEPIVPEELWDKCNAAIEEIHKNFKRPAKKTVHLFSGLAFCHCGPKMYVPTKMNKYVCPKCRNKIPIDDLEAVFQEQLKNFFFSPSEIAKHLETADKVIKEKQELLNSLEAEKESVIKEREKVYRSHINDEIDMKTFGSRFRPLEERVRQIDDQIPALQGEIDFLKIQLLSTDEIINESKDLYSRWKDLLFEEKRRITENITERITIGKDDVSIHLSYLPSASEMITKEQRNLIPALPFCKIEITALKPLDSAYPRVLATLGDHIRKRRLDLKLTQKQVAKRIGATESTINSWELGYFEPLLHFIPRIIEFLGYIPFNRECKTIGEKIKLFRQVTGLSFRKLYELTGFDPDTLANWEKNNIRPWGKKPDKLEKFIDSYFSTCGARPKESGPRSPS